MIPADQQEQIAQTLEDDAQVMSNTQINALLADEPQPVQDEILRINSHARDLSLQVALLVPVLASLIGLLNSFRMGRLPDLAPSGSVEEIDLGLTAVGQAEAMWMTAAGSTMLAGSRTAPSSRPSATTGGPSTTVPSTQVMLSRPPAGERGVEQQAPPPRRRHGRPGSARSSPR